MRRKLSIEDLIEPERNEYTDYEETACSACCPFFDGSSCRLFGKLETKTVGEELGKEYLLFLRAPACRTLD